MNINRNKIVQLADTDTIENLTSALSQRLIADQLRLTTAESCTGGKLASALCAAEDTPKFYGAGFVTFTDQAKMKILSVSQQSLERYSAVSEKVAAEMATGAIERADADVHMPLPATADRRAVKMVRQRAPSGSRGILKARTTLRLCHFAGDCETVLALAVACPRPAAAITAITRLDWRYLHPAIGGVYMFEPRCCSIGII
ncbi:2-oxo-tetronate isomerase [Escherichia coli]